MKTFRAYTAPTIAALLVFATCSSSAADSLVVVTNNFANRGASWLNIPIKIIPRDSVYNLNGISYTPEVIIHWSTNGVWTYSLIPGRYDFDLGPTRGVMKCLVANSPALQDMAAIQTPVPGYTASPSAIYRGTFIGDGASLTGLNSDRITEGVSHLFWSQSLSNYWRDQINQVQLGGITVAGLAALGTLNNDISGTAGAALTLYGIGSAANIFSITNGFMTIAGTEDYVAQQFAARPPPATVATTNAGPAFMSWATETNISFVTFGDSRSAYGGTGIGAYSYHLSTNRFFADRLGYYTNFAQNGLGMKGYTNSGLTIVADGSKITVSKGGAALSLQGSPYLVSASHPEANYYGAISLTLDNTGAPTNFYFASTVPAFSATDGIAYVGVEALYPNLYKPVIQRDNPSSIERFAIIQLGINDAAFVWSGGLAYWATPYSNLLYQLRLDGYTVVDSTLPQMTSSGGPLSTVDLARRSMNDYIRGAWTLHKSYVDLDNLFSEPYDSTYYIDTVHNTKDAALKQEADRFAAVLQTGADPSIRLGTTGLGHTNREPAMETLRLHVHNAVTYNANPTLNNVIWSNTIVEGDTIIQSNKYSGQWAYMSNGVIATSGKFIGDGSLLTGISGTGSGDALLSGTNDWSGTNTYNGVTLFKGDVYYETENPTWRMDSLSLTNFISASDITNTGVKSATILATDANGKMKAGTTDFATNAALGVLSGDVTVGGTLTASGNVTAVGQLNGLQNGITNASGQTIAQQIAAIPTGTGSSNITDSAYTATIRNATVSTNLTVNGGAMIYGDQYKTNGTWIGSSGEVLSNAVGAVTINSGNVAGKGLTATNTLAVSTNVAITGNSATASGVFNFGSANTLILSNNYVAVSNLIISYLVPPLSVASYPVQIAGAVYMTGGFASDGDVRSGGGNSIYFNGRSRMTSPADGAIRWAKNDATTVFMGNTNGVLWSASGMIVSTNSINTGVIAAGQLNITNLTGNIQLGGISGLTAGAENFASVLAIADSSTRTVTLPATVFSADGARTYYVTNGCARKFQFSIVPGVWTNCACVPSF